MPNDSTENSGSAADNLHDRPGCLITGGSAGIGLATAKHFAAQGYNVMICARNPERLDSALDEIEKVTTDSRILMTVECDLAEEGAAQAIAATAIEKMGRVDVLVNNAAIAPLAELEEISDEVFEQAIQVNIKSVFYLTRAIWKHMKSQGRGVVVNISSLAAVDPFPGFSLYGSTKAWVDLMTTALAAEGKEHGLRVYSIRPGAVETQMLRGLFPDFPAEQCVSPQDVANKIWECVDQTEAHESGQHFAVTNQAL
jgi:3-oxoacyl-[acyl-carrier protein] reductase